MVSMSSSKPLLPWVVWGTAVALYVVAIINRSSMSALGPAAQDHFGIEAATLAMFPVIQLIVYAACQIPVGVLLDRFGASVILTSGALLMASGQVVMATVSDVWIAILARVLVGAGDACTFISLMRLLPEWFPPRQLPGLGQATGLIGGIGQLVSVTPLAFAVAVFGWAPAFLGIVAIGLLCLIIGIIVLRDAPGRRTVIERMVGRTGRITRESESISHAPYTSALSAPPVTNTIAVVGGPRAMRKQAEGRESFFMRVRRLLSIPGVRLAFWTHFTTPFAAQVFLLLWGTPFLTGGLGMSPAAAGSLLSLTVIMAMVASVVLGPISSRFAVHRVRVVVIVTLLTAVTWIAVLLWPGMPPTWLVIALILVVPIGGPTSMISFDIARLHTPRSFSGFGTGLVNTGGFTAALIVVLMIGIVLDALGAGSPDTYSLDAFKIAFAVQIPFWAVGLVMIFITQRQTRRWMEARGRA